MSKVSQMESLPTSAVVLDSFVGFALQAMVVETAIVTIKSVAWFLMMMGTLPNGIDFFIKEPEVYAGFPLAQLLAVTKPGSENKDASDTEDDEEDAADDQDEDEDEGEEEDGSGEEGEHEGDPEDEPEANGDGGSGDEDDEDDDVDDDDDDDGEEEEEEEELQPPAKKRK